MKKIVTAAFACGMLTIAFSSCKKDKDGVDCTASAKNLTDKMQAWVLDQSNAEKCKAFKAAWESYAKGDCLNSLSAEQKAAYEDAVKDLDCDAR